MRSKGSVNDPADPMRRDTAAEIAAWLERHGAALRRYFQRRVNPADVDDLVQEVCLRLQITAASYEVVSAERYLFKVARNVLIDRRRLQRTHDLTEYERYARAADAEDWLSPERILLARDEFARVRAAIVNLPTRSREAFVLHRFENMTYTEIALRMRISRETVKDLIHRALTRITAVSSWDVEHD